MSHCETDCFSAESDGAAPEYRVVRGGYLTAPTYDGPPDPIVAGEVKSSRSGAPWVRFGDTLPWYRYMDIPGMPSRNYDGAQIVLDDEGRPLGNSDGPLVIHRLSRGWHAQPINTGWNLDHEIVWEG